MKLKILFFGIAAELVNASEIEFSLSEKATVKECKMELQKLFPKLQNLNSYAIAVNESYATDDVLLKPGDVLAVIPPVSGG
ncbi:MAG: MoaD/ThiS family protein [Polaribacter sp.]|nr:MoaD/ThiS family protein [Polaribacter sp.]